MLLSIDLSRLTDGGELLGLPVCPAKTLVISDENSALWHIRRQRLVFGEHANLISQPFAAKPTAAAARRPYPGACCVFAAKSRVAHLLHGVYPLTAHLDPAI